MRFNEDDFRSAVSSRLTQTQSDIFKTAVNIEQRKNGLLVFRIATGLDVLDGIWDHIRAVCEEQGFQHRRTEKWPTLTELDDILSAIRWVWPRWIPRGFLTLLVGSPGQGKSMFALDWLRIAMQHDATWPCGAANTNQDGCAVWVETEAGQQLLNIRSKNLGVNRDKVFLPAFVTGDLMAQPDLMNPHHCDSIVDIIHQKKPSIVVVDSLGGAHTRGENKIEEVRPILDFLARTARDEDVAILLIHHLRKRGGVESLEITLDRIRGSSGISAFARSVIALDGEMVKVIKSNLTKPPEPLSVKMVTECRNGEEEVVGIRYNKYAPPPKNKTKKERCADFIFAYLTDHGRTKLKDLIDLADAEGYTRRMVYDARDILDGQVAVTGSGKESFMELATGCNPLEDEE